MKRFTILMFAIFMCANVNAHTDDSKKLTPPFDYELKKSVGEIIRGILGRKKIENKSNLPKSIPIQWYDSIDTDRMKNLA